MIRRTVVSLRSSTRACQRFYYSTKKVSDILSSGINEENERTDDGLLDDLSTFGSILKPKSTTSSSPFKSFEKKHNDADDEKFDPQESLSALIKDISIASETSMRRPRSSVHDSELFSKVLAAVSDNAVAMRSSKNKTTTTTTGNKYGTGSISRNPADINLSTLLRRASGLEEEEDKVPTSYKTGQEQKLKVVNALKPTFAIISELQTCQDVLQYAKTNVIQRFMHESRTATTSTITTKPAQQFDDLFQQLDKMDPAKPVLNKITLPVLMEYLIKTLVKDFEAPEEALSLFNSLKTYYPQFYHHACNVDLYNVILDLTWKTTGSLDYVKVILKEMLLNGFFGNMKTIKLLSEIKLDVVKSLSNSDKDLFINKFESYRYHYLTDIDRRMKWLTRTITD